MSMARKQFKLEISFFIMALLLVSLLQPGSASAAADTWSVNQSYPFDLFLYVPCADGGAGEYIYLSGTLHSQYAATLDAAGGFHAGQSLNPQGISGTGLSTGRKYQGVGETRVSFNSRLGYEINYVNNFKMIGQGAGNNLLVSERWHITVLPSYRIAAYMDHFKVMCL